MRTKSEKEFHFTLSSQKSITILFVYAITIDFPHFLQLVMYRPMSQLCSHNSQIQIGSGVYQRILQEI